MISAQWGGGGGGLESGLSLFCLRAGSGASWVGARGRTQFGFRF